MPHPLGITRAHDLMFFVVDALIISKPPDPREVTGPFEEPLASAVYFARRWQRLSVHAAAEKYIWREWQEQGGRIADLRLAAEQAWEFVPEEMRPLFQEDYRVPEKGDS